VSGTWLAPVAAAVATASGPVPWWFRDDDAGWDDDALWALLDVFEDAGVAVDVAAIPVAVTSSCANRLAACGREIDDDGIDAVETGTGHHPGE